MPIWGLLQIIDVAKQNAREKKVRELLTQKGFLEDVINFSVWATSYMWLDENAKKKVYKKINLSREGLEARVENAYILMLQFEDIANVLIDNKKKAREAHLQAVAILKQRKSDSRNQEK